MANYFIGDVHGCYDELIKLIKKINFNPKNDKLWFVGDLIARGSQSLEVLRYIKNLGNSAQIVLGNNDVFLFSVAGGLFPINPKDKIEDILNASDKDELIKWLRFQPVLIHNEELNFVMVHAGISPQLNLKQAKELANLIQDHLQNKNYLELLKICYTNEINDFNKCKTTNEKLIFAMNCFLRMRYCFADGSLELKSKISPQENKNPKIKPWFEIIGDHLNTPIIFGHWGTLMGKSSHHNAYAIDTACIWGNTLTALCWETKKIIQVKSLH